MIDLSVGRIDFINTVPIYYGIDKGLVKCPGRTVKGPPAALNRKLAAGEIQISSVSSAAYIRAHPDWLILPDLSISSRGPVRSVLLCLKEPVEKRLPARVGLTDKSATSKFLARIFLEQYLDAAPSYENLDLSKGVPRDLDAFLVIGDDAFLLDYRSVYPHTVDLGAFWHDWTGLPFVFGLFAVNSRFAHEHPHETVQVAKALRVSRDLGVKAVIEVAHMASRRSGVPEAVCNAYLRHIEYALGPDHRQSLQRFIDFLKARGEARPNVVPEFFETADVEMGFGE